MGRFKRTSPVPDVAGTRYDRFQTFVRADFEQCCAYCYLHEDHIGGKRHFEIDHFCPRKHCPDRVNDFYNLCWSCHGCNEPGNKHAHWPGPALLEMGYGFVDLTEDYFENHYTVSADGTLNPLTNKAEYTIEHLDLNCPELMRCRRLFEQGLRMDAGYTVPNLTEPDNEL